MRPALMERGVVDGFRLALKAKGLVDGSTRVYCHYARVWLAWCKAHELDYLAVTRREITYFIGEHAETHEQATTVTCLHALQQFYDYLRDDEQVIATNPARLVRLPQPRWKPVEPFSADELRRMHEACRTWRERAIFLLLATAGPRREEVCRITKSDVNFERGTVTVRGKGAKYRVLPLGPRVLHALEQALEFEEQLCPYEVRWLWALIKDIAKRAGVKGRIYPHRFRHNFATALLDAGGTIEELQIILGHASPIMSMRYASAGRQQRAVKRMQEIDMAARLLGPG